MYNVSKYYIIFCIYTLKYSFKNVSNILLSTIFDIIKTTVFIDCLLQLLIKFSFVLHVIFYRHFYEFLLSVVV